MKHHNERENRSIVKKILFVVISLILLIIQIYLLYVILFESSKIKWLYIVVVIMGIICVVNLFDKKMNSSYKLIWTILILVLPFTGTLLYLFFGNERSFPLKKSKKIKESLKDYYITDFSYLNKLKEINPTLYKHAMILSKETNLKVHSDTKVIFYSDILKKNNEMLDDIKKAKKFIFIEFFIINNGKLLNDLLGVLIQKAKENVEIKICYDDIGCKLGLKDNTFDELKKYKNVSINKFAAIGYALDLSVNYRDHRKCVIIDGEIAYIGGDNLADEYVNLKDKYGYWRDNAIRIEGEAVYNTLISFAESWYISTKEILDIAKYKTETNIKTNNIVIPFMDGPTDKYNPASDIYTSITNNAKDYLYISTPYLIIDNEFLNHLCNASNSGVDVRILVPGIPDKKLVYILTQSHFGKLLESGVKIYKYTPGFNHAKNYICDDLFGVVGSINLDYRSLYLHFENGVYIYNDEEIKKMKENFLYDLSFSEEIKLEDWKKRKWYKKIIEFILKMFSPLM